MNWNLSFEGGRTMVYLYHTDESGKHFVARFKYARPKSSAKHFAKFLVKNFTPKEYFGMRMANSGSAGTPLAILKVKGYVSLMALSVSKVQIMRDLGLMRVKGANGGTYYE